MKERPLIDLGMTGYDELFMNDQERAENRLPKIYDIPLSEIDDFPDHPFKVKDDEDMLPELLELVDEGRIALRPAVELSYLNDIEQQDLVEEIGLTLATPSHAQAIKMRNFSKEGKLTPEVIESIMCEEKPNQREKINIRYEDAKQRIRTCRMWTGPCRLYGAA